jgi:hypothetical protein
MKVMVNDYTQINGWGVDADPENDPTYPIKHRTGAEHSGYSWERPPQQPLTVEILHSNERPNVSAVFGTSTPPSRLSGVIRRVAFNYSESSYGHWLPLMFADRVNMVEGVLDDLAHGHIPNLIEERGWKAEWQHNRPHLVRRVLVGAVLTSAAIAYLRGRGRDSDREERLPPTNPERAGWTPAERVFPR